MKKTGAYGVGAPEGLLVGRSNVMKAELVYVFYLLPTILNFMS
jgi:hypothetical protein